MYEKVTHSTCTISKNNNTCLQLTYETKSRELQHKPFICHLLKCKCFDGGGKTRCSHQIIFKLDKNRTKKSRDIINYKSLQWLLAQTSSLSVTIIIDYIKFKLKSERIHLNIKSCFSLAVHHQETEIEILFCSPSTTEQPNIKLAVSLSTSCQQINLSAPHFLT